jgi:hypothetical protein
MKLASCLTVKSPRPFLRRGLFNWRLGENATLAPESRQTELFVAAAAGRLTALDRSFIGRAILVVLIFLIYVG